MTTQQHVNFHVHAACSCPCSMSISILHVHVVHAACPLIVAFFLTVMFGKGDVNRAPHTAVTLLMVKITEVMKWNENIYSLLFIQITKHYMIHWDNVDTLYKTSGNTHNRGVCSVFLGRTAGRQTSSRDNSFALTTERLYKRMYWRPWRRLAVIFLIGRFPCTSAH
jgi:hypothetical protein